MVCSLAATIRTWKPFFKKKIHYVSQNWKKKWNFADWSWLNPFYISFFAIMILEVEKKQTVKFKITARQMEVGWKIESTKIQSHFTFFDDAITFCCVCGADCVSTTWKLNGCYILLNCRGDVRSECVLRLFCLSFFLFVDRRCWFLEFVVRIERNWASFTVNIDLLT